MNTVISKKTIVTLIVAGILFLISLVIRPDLFLRALVIPNTTLATIRCTEAFTVVVGLHAMYWSGTSLSLADRGKSDTHLEQYPYLELYKDGMLVAAERRSYVDEGEKSLPLSNPDTKFYIITEPEEPNDRVYVRYAKLDIPASKKLTHQEIALVATCLHAHTEQIETMFEKPLDKSRGFESRLPFGWIAVHPGEIKPKTGNSEDISAIKFTCTDPKKSFFVADDYITGYGLHVTEAGTLASALGSGEKLTEFTKTFAPLGNCLEEGESGRSFSSFLHQVPARISHFPYTKEPVAGRY